MIGYPLSDCQFLMLSNLPCRYDNILMSLFVKSFEGSLTLCFEFMACFLQGYKRISLKRKRKTKKISGLYLRNDWCEIFQIWCVVSPLIC